MVATTARKIIGVEIFSAGTWTDGESQLTRTWTEKDLDAIIKTYESKGLMAPVKLGHTSDDFNTRVAEELDLPMSILIGEDEEGSGQARLGEVVNLRREGKKLIADFDNVLDPVADLIDQGLYTFVSIEMSQDPASKEWEIEGAALLGGENPAVKNLESLQSAAIFSTNSTGREEAVIIRSREEEPEAWSRTVEGGSLKDLVNKFLAATGKFLKEDKKGNVKLHTVAERLRSIKWSAMDLGLPENATLDQIIEKLIELRDLDPTKDSDATTDPAADPTAELSKGGDADNKFRTTAERVLSVNWNSLDLGLPDGPTLDQVINALSQLRNTDQDGGNMTQQALEKKPEEKSFAIGEQDLPMLYESLGLDDTATIEEIIAAIQALRDAAAAAGETAPMPEGTPEMSALSTRVDKQEAYITELEHEKRVAKYSTVVSSWNAIPGAEDLVKELTDLEETAGEAVATKVVASYQASQDTAVTLGVTEVIGTSRGRMSSDAVNDPFEEEVKAYAEKKEVTFEVALATFASSQPREVMQYRARLAGD